MRCILHTVFFQRELGPMVPKDHTIEIDNNNHFTYTACSNGVIIEKINGLVKEFLATTSKSKHCVQTMEIEFYDEIVRPGLLGMYSSKHEELFEQIEIVVMVKPNDKPVPAEKVIRMLRKDVLDITSTLSRITKPLPAIEPTNPNAISYPFKMRVVEPLGTRSVGT